MGTTTLGARSIPGGFAFRVWAPHASQVDVLLQTGTRWSPDAPTRREPLARDGSEYWAGEIREVEPGTLYRFALTHHGVTRQRLDPAARDVIHSALTRFDPDNDNAGILHPPDRTDWAPFHTPRFEDLILYQLHVGSFAGRNDGLIEDDIAGFAEVQTKLGYIREMGFNAIQLLPVQEYAMDRSWGYNPGSFFAPESAYGTPQDLRNLVDAAHRLGIAVLFDVVYNHVGTRDAVIWGFEGGEADGGVYFEGGQMTPWGRGPAFHKPQVREFFFENALMYLEEYRGDGLRFDATTQLDATQLAHVIRDLKRRHPSKLLVAEHLPAHPWITREGEFHATWRARAHHEVQRALQGQTPIDKVSGILGWDGFEAAWRLIKSVLGSHDDCGDQENGDAEHGLSNPDARHRYLVDHLGGRHDWVARAKCRLAWALNVAMPGTPMLFMGSECHMGAPEVAWGYWHDGVDLRGDHRFDWKIAGDELGMSMRRLVAAANQVRWDHRCLRSDHLDLTHHDADNQVLAFVRASGSETVLTVVNLGDRSFDHHRYGVRTGGRGGRWTQILCTQDAAFGGWDRAGNAFHEPWTQADGHIYVNLPQWSVVMFRASG